MGLAPSFKVLIGSKEIEIKANDVFSELFRNHVQNNSKLAIKDAVFLVSSQLTLVLSYVVCEFGLNK